MSKIQIILLCVILLVLSFSCSNPPSADPLSHFYYSEERCQIPNSEFQQAMFNVFIKSSNVFSGYEQKDWPLGVMPVMFIVEPSGLVTHVKILNNAPKDTTFIHNIEDIYYELKFSPFEEQKPDTIIFNSVFKR